MKEKLRTIFLSNKAKTFYWTTLNSFLIIIAMGLADINWIYAPIAIAMLNSATKLINVDILQKREKK